MNAATYQQNARERRQQTPDGNRGARSEKEAEARLDRQMTAAVWVSALAALATLLTAIFVH